MTKRSPFKYFKTSPEVIRLAVMLYVRFPLSLRNVEDLLHEYGIEVSHETVRFRVSVSDRCLHQRSESAGLPAGPVTDLFRSFDLVFCHKGETSWHKNRPQNSALRQCG